ncbi:MAG: HpcH/HpaI aldolase family protein [Planctomycetota bacterium]|jgi:4-hydroxy-2-oxoheptanedioate aldolase
MKREPNRLRRKLAAGSPVIGSVIYSWSPNVMEAAGYAGLDFMRIDNEHAWRQDSSAESLMRAADVVGVDAILRIDKENPYLVRKALEIGAGGIIVPNVYSVEAAENVIRAAKFPPRGIRGYSGSCRSGGWGSRAGAEWIDWSDAEPMIGVMIEDERAMSCVDGILAVDGLDFVLFGPSDYSMSLGLRRPAKNSDEVQGALKKTIAAAKAAGKHVMLGVGTSVEDINRYIEMGVTILEIGNDLGILRAFWSRMRGEVLGKSPA